MSESPEDSPPAPSKPLLLTTFISDAGLPTFQLNHRLPESLLTMFESVLKSMVQGLNSLSGSSLPRAPSSYADAAKRHGTQRSSLPAPKPSHTSASSTSLDSDPPAPQKSKMTLHVSNIPETLSEQEFRNLLKSHKIFYLRVDKPLGRSFAFIRLSSPAQVEPTIKRLHNLQNGL